MRKPAANPLPSVIAFKGQFAEFDEFMEVAAGWELDFRQLGAGKLNASLSQVVCPDWSMGLACFDKAAYQQGLAIPGMRTFAFLQADAPDVDWCGHDFRPSTVAIFANNAEFRSISPPGFDVYTISFTSEQLAATCQRLGIPDINETLSTYDETRLVEPLATRALVRMMQYATDAACSGVETGIDDARDRICEQLVMVVSPGKVLQTRFDGLAKERSFNRALDVIESRLDSPLTVADLALNAGASRRTLEYTFRDKLDVSPKTFINSQRLIRARRDLRNRDDEQPIADIANRWGFWHLGQFARDYRRSFGERPSETSRRRNDD